jgi:hypothetical protein
MSTNTDGNLAALAAYQRQVDEADELESALEQIRDEMLNDSLAQFYGLFESGVDLYHLDTLLDRAAQAELERRIEWSQPDEPDGY